jgi:putative NADH-flavin reductase
MRLFLLGATGNSERRFLKYALERGHQVTGRCYQRGCRKGPTIRLMHCSRIRLTLAWSAADFADLVRTDHLVVSSFADTVRDASKHVHAHE